MLARLFVVLLVEAADQLLEDGAHGVVVERWQDLVAVRVFDPFGTEIDADVEELLDQVAEDVRLDEGGDLVAGLEFIEDFLDIRGKVVQVGLEIGLELLLPGAVLQVAQGEGETL